ncbi:hypothetical protein [Caulobacter phage Kronos]|uniref:Uncharacterized protein n=1 Tax=Caulobacter phage Kronos TaxID=2340873 RepID=A0A386KSN3_9CAUD|nr:hypothetical protein [Caulobacter phage Kronos]
MPALGFMQQHVAAVVEGRKPFTMRKPRVGGKGEPKVGSRLFLFENWRTPKMRKFAEADCVMRTTLWFDERGVAKIKHEGLALGAPPIFLLVSNAIMETAADDNATRELGLHALARFDGFDGWPSLWAYHSGQGLEPDGLCKRRLYGFGNVTPTADANGFAPGAPIL